SIVGLVIAIKKPVGYANIEKFFKNATDCKKYFLAWAVFRAWTKLVKEVRPSFEDHFLLNP
ncbi:MAG TPA: hypothetical protein PLZ45_04620, partial [Ferruginibacter sp.]|nr:hypothetical protein [Ferruginibacter sp.]